MSRGKTLFRRGRIQRMGLHQNRSTKKKRIAQTEKTMTEKETQLYRGMSKKERYAS